MHTDVRLWKGLLFIYLFCREGDYNEFLCHLQGLCDLYQLSRDTWVVYTVKLTFSLSRSQCQFSPACAVCCMFPLNLALKIMLNHGGFPGLVDIFISSRPLSAWHCTGTLSSIENCTVIIIIIIILIVWLYHSSDFKNQRFLQPSKQWKPILIQWQHSLGNYHFLSLIIVIGPNGF